MSETRMGRPNEYFMLRRAARHLVIGLWTSDVLWSQPDRIMEIHAAVKLLREIAATIPDKPLRRRLSYFQMCRAESPAPLKGDAE